MMSVVSCRCDAWPPRRRTRENFDFWRVRLVAACWHARLASGFFGHLQRPRAARGVELRRVGLRDGRCASSCAARPRRRTRARENSGFWRSRLAATCWRARALARCTRAALALRSRGATHTPAFGGTGAVDSLRRRRQLPLPPLLLSLCRHCVRATGFAPLLPIPCSPFFPFAYHHQAPPPRRTFAGDAAWGNGGDPAGDVGA